MTLAGLAISSAVESRRYSERFEEWTTAEPVSVDVDLSQPNVIEAPFTQTCQTAHGESILLRIADAGEKPHALLTDLRAKLEIVDSAGKVVVDTSVPEPNGIRPAPDPEEGAELAYFWPFDTGRYTLRLSVETPAPALAGHKQRLYARYRLCGLEGMPSLVLGIFAVASGIPALLVGGFTLNGLIRHGWRSAQQPVDRSPPNT